MTVVDIAKIAFVTGMTFWLGNASLLGGAMAYAPEAASAVDHLPPWINRAIGLAALLPSPAIWSGSPGRAPSAAPAGASSCPLRVTLVQIGIGATDLCLVTLAMYILLPPSPAVGFLTVLVIFLTATLLGTVSHAPAVSASSRRRCLLGLPQFQKEELLAALLTFRVLYFVLPLFFAALSLGLRELRLLARPESAGRNRDNQDE